jgi:hypothetical protein
MEPDWSIKKTKQLGLVRLISAEYGIAVGPLFSLISPVTYRKFQPGTALSRTLRVSS